MGAQSKIAAALDPGRAGASFARAARQAEELRNAELAQTGVAAAVSPGSAARLGLES